MHSSILGFADGKPAKFTIDPARPRSVISEAFLFRNDFNPVLDASGCNRYAATLSVPSLGGYYTSSHFQLLCYIGHDADVVLGADWLTQCRPTMSANAFGRPAPESVSALPDGHTWMADGMRFSALWDLSDG